MGIFEIFRKNDINSGIEDFRKIKNAVLIDVRTREEYIDGHIPGSKNIALARITEADEIIKDKDIPVYVYCHSGARSERAAQILKSLGYTDVTNAGGIAGYRGEVVKGDGSI